MATEHTDTTHMDTAHMDMDMDMDTAPVFLEEANTQFGARGCAEDLRNVRTTRAVDQT